MNRRFFFALLLLGSLIWATGCSRSDNSEAVPKGAVSPAKTEGTKPARSKPSGPHVDFELTPTPLTPTNSEKAKPKP